MLKLLRACAVSLIALQPAAAPWLAAPFVAVAFATDASAQSRSSGGYSRSAAPAARTPSVSASPPASRTPSIGSSGGYSRSAPMASTPERTAPRMGFGASDSDRSYNSQRSAQALEEMRGRERAAAAAAAAPPPRPAAPEPRRDTVWTQQPSRSSEPRRDTGRDTGSGWDFGGWNQPRQERRYAPPPQPAYPGWYANQGWNPPPYAYAQQGSRFGAWDGMFLWFMLSNLNASGHTDFFRNNANDPGYREWRAKAEDLARENGDIRRQLQDLDRRLDAAEGTGRDPNYLPPGVPRDVAEGRAPLPKPEPAPERRRAPTTAPAPVATPETASAQVAPRTTSTPAAAPASSGGSGTGTFLVILIILALIGGIGFFMLRNILSRRSKPSGRPTIGDVVARAADVAQRKMSDEPPAPPAPRDAFRLGMTVSIDPTPFLLAGEAIKVPTPKAGTTSVVAIGRYEGEPRFACLHLDDGSVLEVHTDAQGNPDECRYFALIDVVTPGGRDDWAFWLAKNEGAIGWADFQTQDGKAYGRVWEPGPQWVEPRKRTEVVQSLEGTRTSKIESMLYAAPTDQPAPAPEAEYILLSSIEGDGAARVEIRAGLAVNPASLNIF